MEAPFVLSVALEKIFRRKLEMLWRYEQYFYPGKRLGERIHDARRLNRPDSSCYQGVTVAWRLPIGALETAASCSLVCHTLRCIVIACDFRRNFKNFFHSTQAKACGSTFAAPLTQ